MKNKWAGILLLGLLLMVATACSGKSNDTGIYKLESFMGMDVATANTLYEQGGGEGSLEDMFVIELKKDGVAVFTVDGEDENCTYTIDGNTITIEATEDSMTGTIEDGKITLTVEEIELVFGKQ